MAANTAAILAIGTELTAGQVTNRNAAWVSERLTKTGFDVRIHECVPDDRGMIQDALSRCALHADLIVVTGGLGPTSDDFTREILSAWSRKPLQWHEASWTKIVKRLSGFGVEVADNNKSQCFYPEGSEIIDNMEGTANAFRFEANGAHVLALPGPPKEGQHVWDRAVGVWLKSQFPNLSPERMWSWKCLGKSEAALSLVVDQAVQGSGLKTAYRVTSPYVEVKVSLPREKATPEGEKLAKETVAKLEATIAPFIVTRGEEDLVQKLLTAIWKKTGTLGVTFLDLGTQGVLTERLMTVLQTPQAQAIAERVEIMTRFSGKAESTQLPAAANEWLFALFSDGKAALIGPSLKREIEIPLPTANPQLTERMRRYRTEKALLFWTTELLQLP